MRFQSRNNEGNTFISALHSAYSNRELSNYLDFLERRSRLAYLTHVAVRYWGSYLSDMCCGVNRERLGGFIQQLKIVESR